MAEPWELFIQYCALASTVHLTTTLEYPLECDQTSVPWHQQGIVSKSHFPWLGIIQIVFEAEVGQRPVMTGLILVKETFGLANAVDLASVPPLLLQADGEAIFYPQYERKLWITRIKRVIVHPNYGTTTFNTAALVELEDIPRPATLKPICWTQEPLDFSKVYYYMSFTEEKGAMEKIAYTLSYVDSKTCGDFYRGIIKGGLGASKEENNLTNKVLPVNSFCAMAKDNSAHCDWENGVPVASNVSGVWNLVGMGMQGPGCASPARFIDLHEYFPWIDATISAVTANTNKN